MQTGRGFLRAWVAIVMQLLATVPEHVLIHETFQVLCDTLSIDWDCTSLNVRIEKQGCILQHKDTTIKTVLLERNFWVNIAKIAICQADRDSALLKRGCIFFS